MIFLYLFIIYSSPDIFSKMIAKKRKTVYDNKDKSPYKDYC